MRGNQVAATTVCVGLALAFAALGSVKAAAQTEPESYREGWTKPFCMQPLWDEKKIEDQNMRWDIKTANEPVDLSDAHESLQWHERWFRPFATQPLWDEGRIEDHHLGWHNKSVITQVDLSSDPHSMRWDAEWEKPFFMQNPWDEQRWDEHCMNWNRPTQYRHRDTADMGARPE